MRSKLLRASESGVDHVVSLRVEFCSNAKSEFFHFELQFSFSFICLFDPGFELLSSSLSGWVGPDAEAIIEFAIVGER